MILNIQQLSKLYKGASKYSVQDLCLTVESNEVFGFLGQNGAGKSTTIKSVVGILPIVAGSIEIDGIDITKQPVQAKKLIGYLSDSQVFFDSLTGVEYINHLANIYKVNLVDRKERADRLVEFFGLKDAYARAINGYSLGMKQKIAVIGSIIHNPKLWILDEPLQGLDPKSVYLLKRTMKDYAQDGRAVFFSSHQLDAVQEICDRVAIIDSGKLKCIVDIKQLKKDGGSLEELYMTTIYGQDKAKWGYGEQMINNN